MREDGRAEMGARIESLLQKVCPRGAWVGAGIDGLVMGMGHKW